jgi:DNA modification methylase
MRELAIAYRRLDDLKPYEKNARHHPKKQIDQLVAAIRTNDEYLNPIVIDEDGVILCGHGRLIAAKRLKMETVPTIQLLGLTELQKRSVRLADNQIGLNAAWDDDLLRIEFKELRDLAPSFDFGGIGFEFAKVDQLLIGKPGREVDDVVGEPPERPVTRLGDIWRLGQHRIGCGDAQDLAFLRRIVGSDLVDAAFLDPPFNVRINGHAVGAGRHREFSMASGEMDPDGFRRFLHAGLLACAEVSRSGAVHFVCMDHRHVEDLIPACEGVYGARLNIVVWRKTNAGMGSLYRSQHEFVFVMRVGEQQHYNAVELGKHGRNRTNVWDYDGVNTPKRHRRGDLDLHPTVKPIALVADAILDVTKPGDLVLDGYLGSGTTLLACVRTGRRFRGLDIDPAYVDVALQRCMDTTGKMAVLEATEKSFAQVKADRLAAGPEDRADS